MKQIKVSLLGIIPIFFLSGIMSVSVLKTQPVKLCNKYNCGNLKLSNEYPDIEYRSKTAGYYDIGNSETDTKKVFPLLDVFTSDYRVFYCAGFEDYALDTISYEIVDRNTIKITCPFILPYAKDYYDEEPKADGDLFRYVSYEDTKYKMTSYEDVWSNVNKILSNKHGQPNFSFSGMDITAKELGSNETISIKNLCSITPITSVGDRYPIQNLTIKMPEGKEVYDFDTLNINLNDIYLTTTTFNTISSNIRTYIEYTNDEPESKTITINPASQLKLSGGTKIQRVSKNAVWYEAPRPTAKGGGAGSFLTKSGANDIVFGELRKDADNHKFSSVELIGGKFVLSGIFKDFSGTSFNYNNDIEPYDNSQFDGSGPFNIYVAPQYETSQSTDRKHEIKKLYAFNQESSDTSLLEFLNQQKDILLYEASVFKDKFPAMPYDEELTEENAIFSDYDFYDTNESALTFSNRENFGYEYLAPGQTTMQTGTDTLSLSIDKPNTFYSIVNKQENSVPVSYTNVFNVHDYTTEQMKQNVVASGSSEFVNHFNALFNRDSTQYMESTSASNKVVFKSADAMFIRISKNGTIQDLTSETKYIFDNLGKASAVPPTGEISYTFDCPGSYEISIVNRGSSKVWKKRLIIYDIADLNVTTTKEVTNNEIDFKVNHPSGSDFTELKVYRSTKMTGADGQQFGTSELDIPLTPDEIKENEFELISDSKTKDTFTFQETPSVDNNFRYTYYVYVDAVDTKKAFCVYWNFVPVTPDTITVDINPNGWQENVKYFTTFNVKMSSTTGWSIDPSSSYEVITAGDAIEVDGNKITAVKTGHASLEFRVKDTDITTVKEFNIGDSDDLRKEIRCSTSEVNLIEGDVIKINAWANPKEYFTDQNLTYTIEDESIATIEDGIISAIKEGPTKLIIHHESEELEDLTIPIQVDKLEYFKFTYNQPEHGSISIVNPKDQYKKNETVTINLKAQQGYYIKSIDINGESTYFDKSQLELQFEKTMVEDYLLTVNFALINQPKDNTGLIVGVCCGVGAVAIGVGAFLIIRAKKVGSMKS